MDVYIKELETALRAVTEKFKAEVQSVRSNRPSPEMVENLTANAYDQSLPIKQLGSLSVVPPREIHITAWDKAAVGPITKAIEEARLGLSVSSEGNIVKASLSALSNERREELMKTVKKTGEEARIQIRGRREDTIKKLKNAEGAGEINEDQVFKGKEKVQKAVDAANATIEQMVEKKLVELGE
jgi:ribosome recycling factor